MFSYQKDISQSAMQSPLAQLEMVDDIQTMFLKNLLYPFHEYFSLLVQRLVELMLNLDSRYSVLSKI